MSERKKVFIYARRSSEKNKERSISIQLQIDTVQAECERRGFEVVKVFKDNKSGFVAGKRDEFAEMLKEIGRRNVNGVGERIDYLFVYMGSRLARNFDEGSVITKLIMDNHLEVFSIKEKMMDCSTNAGKRAWVEIMTEAVFDSVEKSTNASVNMDTAFREK